MTTRDYPPDEQQTAEEYERFLSLLAEIAAVPKTTIYSLEPALRPAAAQQRNQRDDTQTQL